MNKKSLLLESISLNLPNFEDILSKYQKNNPNRDFSLENISNILSKNSYNLKEELQVSASTVANLTKDLIPNRPRTTAKLCVYILGLLEYKYCGHCQETKPFSEFRKNKSGTFGLNTYCKNCHLKTTALTQSSRQSAYRAAQLQALPGWADLSVIAEFYKNCPIGKHVDHIVPLQGELVCGLHVIENLRYLDAVDNCSKGNKFEI